MIEDKNENSCYKSDWIINSSTVCSTNLVNLKNSDFINMTSILLQKGRWEVYGSICLIGKNISKVLSSISLKSSTLELDQSKNNSFNNNEKALEDKFIEIFPKKVITTESSITVYLVVQAYFMSTEELKGCGFMMATRIG